MKLIFRYMEIRNFVIVGKNSSIIIFLICKVLVGCTYNMWHTSVFNTYSMKQPDIYYFEAINMTAQALSYFIWRIRAAGEARLFHRISVL